MVDLVTQPGKTLRASAPTRKPLFPTQSSAPKFTAQYQAAQTSEESNQTHKDHFLRRWRSACVVKLKKMYEKTISVLMRS